MSWLINFLTSSIGKKLVMSLTGLFLIIFLFVHLLGNLQLMISDGGQAFNEYAHFMTTNPIIKLTSYLLYFFILLHAIQGIILWRKNASARGNVGYRERKLQGGGWAAQRMGWLGTVILIFILIHMYQFWLQMKMGVLDDVTYNEVAVANLYAPVAEAFSNIWFVIFYAVSMLFIAFHLWHGFQSAFQTLGIRHKKYTPFIMLLGKVYSILIPVAFATIPLYFYFVVK